MKQNPDNLNNEFDELKNELKKEKKNNDKKGGKGPGRMGFINMLLIALFVLLLITSAYSLIADRSMPSEKITLSELAQDVGAGKISSITVKGDDLIAEYKPQAATATSPATDKILKGTKKEADAAITETLSRYGVTPTQLSNVKINVEGPSGFWFWLGQVAPFLAPLIFLGLIIWFLSRQVRGAGVQALSFGQSKARVTLPDDKKQKVTFKDVAGAKEAKQELTEIVDFLRNPRKFLEIGAVIPKGILLMGAPGTGKCITGDSLVLTNKGPMRIDEIPKYFSVEKDATVSGLKIISYNPKITAFEERLASHWYDLGVQDTYKITTDSGMAIEGTPEHPVVIVEKETGHFKFKKLGEMTEGDVVVIAKNAENVFKNNTKKNLTSIFYRQRAVKSVWTAALGQTTAVLDHAPIFLSEKREVSSGNFFFTKVSKISKGKTRVYDLTVPELHNFLANGFINHNTLLARAVAGEANVAFFSISGSEFVEMFVGVGASRVRDLFTMAKKAAPAIIFVDEIDAVGRVRGTGVGGGNDEREQTLNQILVEMDGFEPNEKVIVMAATNRPDVLDPALLRPGRFDRRVTIDLPDRHDREEILKIHARKKPFAEDVNLKVIAERTPGFSGADLYSLMNEGAILAARENRTKVSQYDLIRAIEKVLLGPERKSHILSKKEKEITAYHEAGHAIVSSVLPYADPVHKISIISRGRAAGYTLHLPLEDRKLQSKKEFHDDLAVSLGGYVVERMMFDDVTTGPSNDLQVSTALARDMVTRYGMSEKLGAMAFEAAEGRAMFGKGLDETKVYSDEIASQIDQEVSRIMKEAYDRAAETVKTHRKALDAVAERLIEVETIERDEYEKIIIAHGIMPKKKLDIEHQ